MSLNPLKYLILAENFVSVHRNYCMVSKCKRIALCVRSLLEVIGIIANMKIYLDYHTLENVSDEMFFFLATGNSIVIIIMSLIYSKEFQKLVVNFNDYNTYLNSDIVYSKRIERKQKLLAVAVAMIFSIKLLTFFLYHWIIGSSDFTSMSSFMIVVLQLTLCMCDFRYILEYFVLYFVMYVLSEQLNGITRDVVGELVSARSSVEESGDSSASAMHLTLEHREQVTWFDKWSAAYANIRESLKLCNNIFDAQVTMMLATTLFYYVILLYTVTTLSVEGNFTLLRQFMYFFSLSVFLTALFMLSRSAQTAENNAVVLTRKLCILLLHSLESEPRYKATKDLLRLISTRPICMQAFGSISVNMTLLPSCVAFFTSYTVIALQFNNVV